jgi:hypothetical protein
MLISNSAIILDRFEIKKRDTDYQNRQERRHTNLTKSDLNYFNKHGKKQCQKKVYEYYNGDRLIVNYADKVAPDGVAIINTYSRQNQKR